MIPFGWWLWYRGVMPNAAVSPALGIVAGFTLIDLLQEIDLVAESSHLHA